MKVILYTKKDWNNTVECVHGVVDEAALEAFHYGHCHVLALALHEATGWPLIGIWYEGDTYDDDYVPAHVAVRHPDGYIVDIYGAYTKDPGDLEITDTRPLEPSDVVGFTEVGYKGITYEAQELAESLVDPILSDVQAFLDTAQESV